MADNVPFSPLDPLGPEFGRINNPIVDSKGLEAFEGDSIRDPQINFPTPDKYFSVLAGPEKLNRPNRSIEQNFVRSNAVNPSIPQRKFSNQTAASSRAYLDSFFQANQQKNNFGKIYSYNAGPDGNAFYKRYAAYGQQKFDQIGFSPLRDNEANFNARTTRMDDFSRMISHSFVPLFTNGFTAGPKSLLKMLKGDFTSGDLEEAEMYEQAAAIGQSSKGGVFGFVNNATMNFGYTAGIIVEAIAEEAAGVLLAAPTGGASLLAATANNAMKISKIGRSLFNGYKAVSKTLSEVKTLSGARNFFEAARKSDALMSVARGLNPLENTMDAFKALNHADNFADLALLSKTAGGFYRDVRNINMAVSEARLEAGMQENHVYNKLYTDAYSRNNEVPSNKELAALEKQAKDASYDAMLKNTALIYASNAITFNNITSPRGGLRNFFKGTTEDIYKLSGKAGGKNFGSMGSVVYNRISKAAELQKNNFRELAKSWMKQPVYKSAKSTVGYFKANFTEGFQENMQEIIAGANERYYIDSYKSPALTAQLYSQGSMGMISKTKSDYYGEELDKQFTAQGAETFASGFFMGALAGPLNNAVPFISTGYNRIFNKDEYNKWKTDQTAIASDIISTFNNMDMQTFVSDRNLNLGSQDLISKIRQNGTKKEGKDSEVEAYVNQVNTMLEHGTSEMFKEKLLSFNDATDKEFADAFKIEEAEVPKYRGRLNLAVERLNRVEKIKKEVDSKYPNPVSREDLLDVDAPDHVEKVLLYNAWSISRKNMVFFNETYNDASERIKQIETSYTTQSNFQSINSNDKDLLFNPFKMNDEIDLVKKELDIEKDLGKDPKKIKQLNEKLEVLEQFSTDYLEFDKFFNRADYSSVVKEELSKVLGREATPEEIAERFELELGSIDNSDVSSMLIGKLKETHDKYLKTLASHNNDTVFDKDATDAFNLLVDHYKLNHEKKAIVQYINLMDNPESFLEQVRRNQEWLKNFNDKKVRYFEELVISEMGKVRDNAFLNVLADNGYFLNEEDMIDYLGNKNLPPKEIFNNITKEIYPQGSVKYNEIYEEFFKKRADLKKEQNPKKSNIVKRSYEDQIQELNTRMQDEINALPTTPVKSNEEALKKKGKNKTFAFVDLYDQLPEDAYVEATYKNMIEPIVFYKDPNGDMHYDNMDGEYVDFDDIKIRFDEATKYIFINEPDPASVKVITDKYDLKIADIQKAFTEDMEDMDESIPYEEVTQDTDLTTADLTDFRNNVLYTAFINEFVPTLSQEEQDEIFEDDAIADIRFEEWYKKPENKKYFDDYNKANKPKDTAEDFVFTFDGTDINTKTASLEELVRYRDNIAVQLMDNEFEDVSPEDERLLKLDLKNINNIIKQRQFAKFSPVIKEGVRKIQKLINAQKNIEEKFMLTEDDPETGLKAGDIAYRVNGKIHRRVTNALQDVLGEDYVYGGAAAVDKVFNLTINKKGLNKESIEDFISQLNGLLSSKSPGNDPLPGANALLIADLEVRLKKLTGLSKEQIDLERAKEKILNQMTDKSDELSKAREEGNETRIESYSNQINSLIEKVKEVDRKLKALEKPSDTTPEDSNNDVTVRNTTKDIISNFFIENTYQDGRDAGNFLDEAKDFLESGVAPAFDDKKISGEAYDNLFNPVDGFLTQLKRKVDAGEFYLIGRDLRVYDSEIIRSTGVDRIAGEIDLLLATDKGIVIVDIKSGEINKWFNFNNLSTDKKKIYSKREEYTLQQASYATMLEKMINAPVAGIALLPIQRSSDKDLNKIMSAGKPDSESIFYELEYAKNPDGSFKRNDQGELVQKVTKNKYSEFFIPLYRESVKDKIDLLFPQSSLRIIKGLETVSKSKFDSIMKNLESITNVDNEANNSKLKDIEADLNDFITVNNLEIPEDISLLLNDKKEKLNRTKVDNTINSVLLNYESQAATSNKRIEEISERVKDIDINTVFDDIDLSAESAFIQTELENDKVFKDRYDIHEDRFVGKSGSVTSGQTAAINVLNLTGVITNDEINEYESGMQNKEVASTLIHEAVKRIQYLIKNTTDKKEIAKFKAYQKDIITLISSTRSNADNKRFLSVLNNIKEDVDSGQFTNATIKLDNEILRVESDLSNDRLSSALKTNLTNKLNDLEKVKASITSLSDYIDISTDLIVEAEEEIGEIEVVDLGTIAENKVTVGTNIFENSINFTPYIITKVNKDGSVEAKDASNKKIKLTMQQLTNDYITDEQLINAQDAVSNYKTSTSEKKVIKESLDAVGDFIKNLDSKNEGYAEGIKKSDKQIREELIKETKNCQ